MPVALQDKKNDAESKIGQRAGGSTGGVGEQVPDDGLAFAIFYTKVHDRVLAPLFAAGQPQAPPALRAALTDIQHHIDNRLAAARLPMAA